jgi:hypothetical protein
MPDLFRFLIVAVFLLFPGRSVARSFICVESAFISGHYLIPALMRAGFQRFWKGALEVAKALS